MMQRLLISFARRSPRNRGFTLVEVMVVVVIIGLLAAMSLPAYRRITMRSKTAAVVSDLRSFSTAFITYSLQNGHWPADAAAQAIPPEMLGSLSNGFAFKSPIGGVYKWNYDVSADGIAAKAAIIIETAGGEAVSDDADLREMIDREMDDGDLSTGNVQLGSTNSLVFIIEK
jgi:prepilin-type N-terminal cleavage/methylation domain-containing protein